MPLEEYMKNNNIKNKNEFKLNNAWRIIRDVSTSQGAKQLADNKKLLCNSNIFLIKTSQNKVYAIRKDYNQEIEQPRMKILFADEYLSYNPCDLWLDISTTGLENEGFVEFKNSKKPEKLIERCVFLSSNPGDLVLDSFLGSGTTAAVAHKMGRRWIGIEMGDHAYTHCKVRLDKVVSGEDQGGISKAQNWKGGGGYKFYELAPSLVVEDKFGNPIINKEYNADMLAAAMALQEGFAYQPDKTCYWKQGKNENAYIYTTTNHITAEYLSSIAAEMQDREYLIVACKTYDGGIERMFKNITIKKIPQILLGRCEFGKDNYNLNIVDIPTVEDDDE